MRSPRPAVRSPSRSPRTSRRSTQYKKLVARIEDLETRATLAIQGGKHDLAREAAETIALLEAERAASDDAQRSFTAEIERLKRIVRSSELRLRELQRGQRIAAATDKTQRLREAAPGSSLSALKDAEETLSRLRLRQKQMDAAASAMAEMELSTIPAPLSREAGRSRLRRADPHQRRRHPRTAGEQGGKPRLTG